jgi:hypothetical protein
MRVLPNFETDALCPFINSVFGIGEFAVPDPGALQTMGHAMVGRHPESQEGDPGVWFFDDIFFCCLLRFEVYPITLNKNS